MDVKINYLHVTNWFALDSKQKKNLLHFNVLKKHVFSVTNQNIFILLNPYIFKEKKKKITSFLLFF